MANPVVVPITANTWTPVASATTKGSIYQDTEGITYRFTHRNAGEPTPTTQEGSKLWESKFAEIRNDVPIDVYVWANKDAVVVVDL